MQKINTSSGDILTDRRLFCAEMLFERGEKGAAAELLQETLSDVSDWAGGWFRLGEFYEAIGEPAQACHAWSRVLEIDPLDHYGVALKLSLAGAIPTIQKPPVAFVETLFDAYADRFEKELKNTLDYRVPDLLIQAIQKAECRSFDCVIDLGCGTGLMGEKLRPFSRNLYGYDISSQMLEKAKQKKIYTMLLKCDLEYFAEKKVNQELVDLITAADVFTYFGCLRKIIYDISLCLKTNGLLAFSVENHEAEEEFILQETRRYTHSYSGLYRLLSELGFSIFSMEPHVIRMDNHLPVHGLIGVVRKS